MRVDSKKRELLDIEGLFEECCPNSPIKRLSDWSRLKGTDFFYSVRFNFWFVSGNKLCPHKFDLGGVYNPSFEEVLDSSPDDIKEKLLFHLDLFA